MTTPINVYVSSASARFLTARGPYEKRVSEANARFLTSWNDTAVEIRFSATYIEVLATKLPDFSWGGASTGGFDAMFKSELFPYNISFDSISAATFADDVVVVNSGVSQRTSRWDQPLLEFDVGYGVRTMEQLGALISFFRAVRGRMYGFLYYDPIDHTSSVATAIDARAPPAINCNDQSIGVGDGTTKVFQLTKTYQSPTGLLTSLRPICKPIPGGYDFSVYRPPASPVMIGLNGVNQSTGWTVDYTTGLVTFASPPSADVLITAGYEFFVPVAFNTPRLPVSLQYYGIGQATEVKLIELRPAEAFPT